MNGRLGILESPVGARVRLNGREVDYFCGTSYFCLHGHPDIIAAACAAATSVGLGSATSLATPAHVELEQELRSFFRVETATLVPSGYLAPLVLLQALDGSYDVVLIDSAAHYGEIDAARAIGKPSFRFQHLDPDDLRRQLELHVRSGCRPLVLTDGVFPSTGAMAPLPDYVAALSAYAGGLLCVDDAHGFGVLGEGGRGSLEHHGIETSGAHACGTLSKAFGATGGIVPGSTQLARDIRARSRVPAGASSPSAPAVAAAAAAVRLLAEHPEMRRTLWRNVARLRDGLCALGFDLAHSPVPIVSLAGRPGLDLHRVHSALADQGIATLYVPPRGYSDAPDVESLRIAVFSTHTDAQIDRLVAVLGRAL